jgi:hypothetical protein
MGQIRFRLYDRERISEAARSAIYMCGLEEIPWRSRTFWDADVLVVERLETESGRVHVPWRREGGETIYVGTSTLMERPAPYVLEVELARGLLHAIRQQLAQWEPLGMTIPAEIELELEDVSKIFYRAAVTQHELGASGPLACRSLDAALGISQHLGQIYSRHALAARREVSRPLNTLLGIDLGAEPLRLESQTDVGNVFSLVNVPCGWRRLEAHEGSRDWSTPDAQFAWAASAGLKVCCGPLLRMHGEGFPDWMYLWAGDFDNLLAFMLDHVRSVVNRYRGRVHLWHVASRVNSGSALSLDEDEKLRMVASATQVIRQLDPRIPIVASFDRPWGEYLAEEDGELAPLQFADALARADLGLVGMGLEIAEGYWPEGSFRRHAIAHSRLLDQWSLLGMPLVLLLTAPSNATPDPRALRPNAAVDAGAGGNDDSRSGQAAWIEQFVPLALAKSFVQVLIWNQLEDAAPHELPHGGLYDQEGRPKPALDALRKVRGEIS